MSESARLTRVAYLARALARELALLEGVHPALVLDARHRWTPEIVEELAGVGVSLFLEEGAQLTSRRVANILPFLVQLRDAQRRVEAASEGRARLEGGAARAVVTAANARWVSESARRDRVLATLRELGVDVHAHSVRAAAGALPSAVSR